MYNFKEIDEKTINEFNDKNEKGHIFQTSYWAHVKDSWVAKYIGGYDDKNNLVLTCMLILRKIPYTGKYMGYSPRGFVCDYSNEQLIKEFTQFIKSYGKKNKAAFITFDPDIHLKEDEKPLEFGVKVRDFLVSLGYVNKEVKNFENIQPNFVFRLGIDKTLSMEDRKKALFDAFTSKTRYNIKVAEERGLSVDVYDKDNVTDEVLDKFYELMATTGKRDNFITRHREYFKNMVDYMYPYCRIYMVKYSYSKDSARLNQKIQSQQKNIERCKKKKENAENNLTKETVEDKINKLNKKIKDAESGISESEREISGFQKRLQEIEPYKGREVYVSGSVYLYYSGKGWYLYGASDNILRDTMPNFLMQWKMIQDTVDLDCYMYDFRGVSGDLNPDNPLYGLYKFKKGFNGKFVEFIGQFDVVIDGFIYGMFKTVFPQFKKIRDVIMRK